MYNIIKSIILASGYKLADIQFKVKKMYIMGDITEDQMTELLNLAVIGASPDAERPEIVVMLQTLLSKIETLEARVKALEEADDPEKPDEPVQPVYEAWEPWNGIDNRYQPGAIVTHNGKIWKSVYEGQNVWEPGVVGINFWKEIVV